MHFLKMHLRKAIGSNVVRILFVGCVTGCTTVSVTQEPTVSAGSTVYEQPYSTVWSALKESIDQSEMEVIADSDSSGIMLVRCKGCSEKEYAHITFYVEQQKGTSYTKVDLMDAALLDSVKIRDQRIDNIILLLDEKMRRATAVQAIFQ